MKKKTIHYSRTGYNGDFTYTSVCGKEVRSHQDHEESSISPQKTNCKECMATKAFKTDLVDNNLLKTHTLRRIYIESDILQADEFRNAQREVADFAKQKGLSYVDRVFSEVLDFAYHDLEKTWQAVKDADEIYATSSLLPLSGGSYMGAPAIFNGMCERAVKENISGKSVIILNKLENISWGMIDIALMKKVFKVNSLYMYNDEYDGLIKVDVLKVKK